MSIMYSTSWRDFCKEHGYALDVYIHNSNILVTYLKQELSKIEMGNILLSDYKDYKVDRAMADGRVQTSRRILTILEDFTS